MQNNKVSRFAASALTASLVVTAIAPMASASNFIDIGHLDKQTKAELNRAVELKMMSGVGKKFLPNQAISRGQVAKALAKHIAGKEGKTIKQYFDEYQLFSKVKSFEDISSKAADQELFQAGLIVKYNKVFEGVNNRLQPSQNISRQHMATVLVRAFDLKETGQSVPIKDLNKAVAQHRASIERLAQNGITQPVKGNFNPTASVKRIQMASFLVRANDLKKEPIPEVQSIQLKTTAVSQADNQQLHFMVNEQKQLTVQQLTDAGYTVTFAYNKASASKEAVEKGIVNASTAPFNEKFQYQVLVKKGQTTVKSNWQTVEVHDPKIAVEVTEVQLIQKGEPFPLSSSITLSDKEVTVKPVVAKNAMGEQVGVVVPEIENIVSSNIAIAYFENGVLVPNQTGKVLFEVYFKGVAKPYLLPLEIVAGQKPQFKTLPVKEFVEQGVHHTLSYPLVDQVGQPLRRDLTVQVTQGTQAPIQVVVRAGEPLRLPIDGLVGVAKYTIAEGTNVMGQIEVEGKEIGEASVSQVVLQAPTSIIDLKLGKTNSFDLTVVGYANGIRVSNSEAQAASRGMQFRSDNTDVAKVTDRGTVIGLTPGKTVIHLVEVQGEKETKKASYEVEVMNTTIQIATVALKNGASSFVVKDATTFFTKEAETTRFAYLAANLTAGRDAGGNELFSPAYIEQVKYVAANKQMIIKIKAANGGKEFVLPVTENDKKAMYAQVIGAKKVGEKAVTFTFSDAVVVDQSFAVANYATSTLPKVSKDGKQVQVNFDLILPTQPKLTITGLKDRQSGIPLQVTDYLVTP